MKRGTLFGVLFVMLAIGGCEEETIQVGRGLSAQAAPGQTGPATDLGEDAGVDAGPSTRDYRDEDFVEADTNRDPFRNYVASFQAGPVQERSTREVKMPETSIDEMRLIAIVSGVADARAMILDREGVGQVVRRGEYIGRAEVVQAGGLEQIAVTLNWRVDRIRPNAVVLTREDPTAPNRPPLTRVLPLREEDEDIDLELAAPR